MVDIQASEAVRSAIKFEEEKDRLIVDVVEPLLRNKSWEDMDGVERRACVRALVVQTESEGELLEGLALLGIEDFSVAWHLPDPDDQTGQEAQMLVKALGGLVSKNGALVMIMTPEEQF